MTDTISVVVADDQPLVRAGIAMLLSAQPDITVVAEASDGAEAVAAATAHDADLVLMDIRMPGTDGVAATRLLVGDAARRNPPVRVLVLTTFDDDEAVYGALRAGASGFLLKHAAPQDLITAVRRVIDGDSWIDPAVTGRVLDVLRATDPRRGDPTGLVERLTPREREVLVLMAQGLSNTEIADGLVLSEATVRTHVNRILMKTACTNRTKAVVLAYQSGLVRPGRTPDTGRD